MEGGGTQFSSEQTREVFFWALFCASQCDRHLCSCFSSPWSWIVVLIVYLVSHTHLQIVHRMVCRNFLARDLISEPPSLLQCCGTAALTSPVTSRPTHSALLHAVCSGCAGSSSFSTDPGPGRHILQMRKMKYRKSSDFHRCYSSMWHSHHSDLWLQSSPTLFAPHSP